MKVSQMKKLKEIKENCQVKVNEVVAMLDISHDSACHIIHNMLQFHKVDAKTSDSLTERKTC
jgi:hypothetical protein